MAVTCVESYDYLDGRTPHQERAKHSRRRLTLNGTALQFDFDQKKLMGTQTEHA